MCCYSNEVLEISRSCLLNLPNYHTQHKNDFLLFARHSIVLRFLHHRSLDMVNMIGSNMRYLKVFSRHFFARLQVFALGCQTAKVGGNKRLRGKEKMGKTGFKPILANCYRTQGVLLGTNKSTVDPHRAFSRIGHFKRDFFSRFFF